MSHLPLAADLPGAARRSPSPTAGILLPPLLVSCWRADLARRLEFRRDRPDDLPRGAIVDGTTPGFTFDCAVGAAAGWYRYWRADRTSYWRRAFPGRRIEVTDGPGLQCTITAVDDDEALEVIVGTVTGSSARIDAQAFALRTPGFSPDRWPC
jgi:hypothetical protein